MRLLEFQNDFVTIDQAIQYLNPIGLDQLGGDKTYHVGSNVGRIYAIGRGPSALGLVTSGNTLISAAIWKTFNLDHHPDFEVTIPRGDVETILQSLRDIVTGRLSEDETPLKPEKSNMIFRDEQAENIDREITNDFLHQSGDASMEEQYEELQEKVRLVASGSSNYIKSLLITGAPSAGKSYNVVKVVESLGLVEGRDYVVVKGSITDAALYLTFIEQIDSLTIFDDCDSVVESKDGRNMLKNALDTNPVRDISYVTAKSLNTKHMSGDDRQDMVDAISRILRGAATKRDIDRFDHYIAKPNTNKVKVDQPDEDFYGKMMADFSLPDSDGSLNGLDEAPDAEKLKELQNYFMRRPPNRIDFRGRIIFISNMREDEWDSAILTRAFRQNMDFSSGDMLDFIWRIRHTIKAPNLTDAQKDEVLNYIRARHNRGMIKSRINFRLVQQAFDLRLCEPWKRMIAAL